VTKVEKKEGKEQPPQLYDLTSLQVDCNRKFGYSAEMTLNLIQSLYEKKFTTYPRVDTQYLSDDIYPKCPQTLNGLYQTKFGGVAPYAEFIKPIGGKSLKKTKRVFDTSKVTDHHAIIPTGVIPQNLSDAEQKVFDLVARRFIGVFLPDCKFSTTTVLGEVDKVTFKVTGKEILEPGWRIVREDVKSKKEESDEEKKEYDSEHLSSDEERTLPTFVKGESGDHKPTLTEKWTTPPPYYNEASLLRAMETAGKFVEDETLRAAMKENGIGRPSSRAGIIETLFKRHYIKRDRKRLIATPTGIELIDLIREELLKSCELTGIWEKKLRDIEHQKYDATQFIEELKAQVAEIVNEVMSDSSNRRVTVLTDAELKKVKSKADAGPKTPRKKKEAANTAGKASATPGEIAEGQPCPLCGQGRIIKGKTAYGCSRWKEGCNWRQPF
jgi:DNA topoisomerase-3